MGRTETTGRIKTHLSLLRRNKHPIGLMQFDFNKYGAGCFISEMISENIFTEREWMERLQTYNPNYGYNYLDPYFLSNSTMNRKDKKAYVAEKYNFEYLLL